MLNSCACEGFLYSFFFGGSSLQRKNGPYHLQGLFGGDAAFQGLQYDAVDIAERLHVSLRLCPGVGGFIPVRWGLFSI